MAQDLLTSVGVDHNCLNGGYAFVRHGGDVVSKMNQVLQCLRPRQLRFQRVKPVAAVVRDGYVWRNGLYMLKVVWGSGETRSQYLGVVNRGVEGGLWFRDYFLNRAAVVTMVWQLVAF